jgi:aminopeptidase N
MKGMQAFIKSLFLIGIALPVAGQVNPERGHAEHILTCSKANHLNKVEESRTNPGLDDYDITHYFLDIEVSPLNTDISGKASITASSTVANLQQITLQLIHAMQVDSILLNDQDVSFSHENNELQIQTLQPISEGQFFTVTVFYHGNSIGWGVTQGYNEEYETNVTWSLSESFHAKEWWPTKEVLSDKADSATIILTTDKAYTAVSNGVLYKKEAVGGNKVSYHWKTRYPINYYLVSFAVADYQEYTFHADLGNSDSVLVQNFVYDAPGYLEEFQDDIDETAAMITLFSELLGTYPYSKEKYGHALSELGGGMEHQTITTLGRFTFLLVAHELVHQWFGDYVTCASWQDIWINEGFASYGEYLALEFLEGREAADEWMKISHQYAFQEPGGSVYIPFEDSNNEQRIFNLALSYKKGAAIIHTLRYLIDDDPLFFKILRNFLYTYKNSVATGEDFLSIVNQLTDRDFNWFFQEWYYGKGFPEYEVSWQQVNDSVELELFQVNSASTGAVFTTPVELKLLSSGKDTLITLFPAQDLTTKKIYFSEEVLDIIVDPDNWILNKDKYFTYISPRENTEDNIRIYPNPFRDFLNLELDSKPDEEYTIRVFQVDGTMMLQRNVQHSTIRINTSAWQKGVYLLEIVGNKSQLCKKIVK